MDNTITTLEMCAGYGGIGLGIKNIFGERLRTIAYCELEGFAQANLISKMEKGLLDAAPIWNDLKTFPYESFHGLVDILIAGYPCQPFSAAGKRAGKEDPRHLWPWIADGIRLLQPTMCFFENVEGHISLGLSTVISDLEELGYTAAWGIFSASEVGAPHQRKRVFILANARHIEPQGWGGAADGQQSGAGRIPRGEPAPRHDQVWPSRPGQQQYAWEPPRVMGNSDHGGLASGLNARSGAEADRGGQGDIEQAESGQAQPPLGRDAYEPPIGMDLSELSRISNKELEEIRIWMHRCDNRTDELRLLGNGVVPATAKIAFINLYKELISLKND